MKQADEVVFCQLKSAGASHKTVVGIVYPVYQVLYLVFPVTAFLEGFVKFGILFLDAVFQAGLVLLLVLFLFLTLSLPRCKLLLGTLLVLKIVVEEVQMLREEVFL